MLKESILNPAIKVKIAPFLLILGGLPDSCKSLALNHLMKKIGGSTGSVRNKKEGIFFCDIFAANNLQKNTILMAPSARNRGYPSVVYSAVENMVRSMGKRLMDVNIKPPLVSFPAFKDDDLDKHFEDVMANLHEDNLEKQREFTEWDQSYTCGLALVNVWDLGINKVPTYLLSRLAGHLYNSHVWLFLDLLRDVDHLYEVPDNNSFNDEMFTMKWQSRIEYFLSFAQLARRNSKDHEKVCSIIGSIKELAGTKEKVLVAKLIKAVNIVSKQLKLDHIIDVDIVHEFLAFEPQGIKPLIKLLESVIKAELDQAKEVPLSFIFLRSMLCSKDALYIAKEELEEIASKLKMSLNDFCKLFTSFGSIIDVSLIDCDSHLVILKPVPFLKKLEQLFYYSGNDTLVTTHSLISDVTSKSIFGKDDHVFMSFLESLTMAVQLLKEKVNVPFTGSYAHYVPIVCTNPPLVQCSPSSLYLQHDMNTTVSHLQVLFTEKFLNSYPESQLNVTMTPHINITRFCSPSVSLLFELVYHGDIIEFRFPPDLHEEVLHNVCERIVIICHGIMDQSDILYDFAIMCSDDAHPCKLQTPFHSFPIKMQCKKCSHRLSSADIANIDVFNSVLVKVRPK